MRLFDSHAHLDFPDFDPDRDELLREMRDQGIAAVNVGIDLGTSRGSLELARAHGHVFPACGIHPHEASGFSPAAERELRGLLGEGAVAVGEIGLDYYRDLSPRGKQREAFRAQLRLAKELGLPVILHCREAEEDFLEILAEVAPVRGVWHSFSGGIELARRALDLGLFLGIGGPLTYRKNEPLRQAVREIPLDRILIETDSPFLPPEPFRGKRNDPLKVRLVALKIAELKGISLEEVAEATFAGACRLFGVEPDLPGG
jgi:TatD DNase family protein